MIEKPNLLDSVPTKTITVTEQEARIIEIVRSLKYGKIIISKEGGKILPVKIELSTDTSAETIKIIKV